MTSANPARAARKNTGETIGGLGGALVGAATPLIAAYGLGEHAGESVTDQLAGTAPAGHPFDPDSGLAGDAVGAASGLATAAGAVPFMPIPASLALPSAIAGGTLGANVGRGLGHAYHDLRSIAQTPEERLRDMRAAARPSERPVIDAFSRSVKQAVSPAALQATQDPVSPGNAIRHIGRAGGAVAGLGAALAGGSIAGGLLGDFAHDTTNFYSDQEQQLLQQARNADNASTLFQGMADHPKPGAAVDPETARQMSLDMQATIPDIQHDAQSAHRTAKLVSGIGHIGAPLVGVGSGLALLAAKPVIAPLYSMLARGAVEPLARAADALTPTRKQAELVTQVPRGVAAILGTILGAGAGAVGATELVPDSLAATSPVLADHASHILGTTGGLAGGIAGGQLGYQAGKLLEKPEEKQADWHRPALVLGGGAVTGLAAGLGLGSGLEAIAPSLGADPSLPGWNPELFRQGGTLAGAIGGSNLGAYAVGRMLDRRKKPITMENLPNVIAGLPH